MCRQYKSFKNTIGKREISHNQQFLVTSNFSIPHIVFYLFGEFSTIFIKLENVVRKLFQFGRV